MSFQYTYDADGKPIGVFVPIAEWNKINGEIKNKKAIKSVSNAKEKILKGISRGMNQVRDIEKGKIKSISLNQMLDAL